MFKSIARRRTRFAVAMLLVLAFLTQLTPTAYAGNNGNSDSVIGYSDSGSTFDWWGVATMVIMLTADPNFILSPSELRIEPGKFTPSAYAEFEEYENYSISKAYAQQFRRTYLSWEDEKVQESILFVGSSTGRFVTGIRWSHDGALSEWSKYDAHAIVRYPYIGTLPKKPRSHSAGNSVNDFFYELGEKEEQGSFTASGLEGEGIYKIKLVDYMDAWFNDSKTTMADKGTAEAYIRGLIASAGEELMERATYIWAYITQGIEVMTSIRLDYVNKKGVPERWETCFVEPGQKEFDWDKSYLGKGAVKEETDSGDLAPILSAREDGGRAYRQVAGYLDSLLTIALMALYNGKTDIAEQYIKAAIAVFGSEGVWVQNPEDMEQKYALVLGKAVASNFHGRGHEVTDFFDFWVQCKTEYFENFEISGDFRSNNSAYNDWSIHPVLADSPQYQKWAVNGKADESVDRIKLRLSMQTDDSLNLTVWDNIAEIDGLPGSAHYGSVAASLGRTYGSAIETITRGMGANHGVWQDYPQLNLVGGQFLIGFFANAGRVPSSFKQSLHTKQEPTLVSPTNGTLGQKPQVTYKFGTGWVTDSGAATAANDVTITENYLKMVDSKLREDKGAKLEIRTSFSSEVVAYETAALGAAGDPLHSGRVVTAQESKPREALSARTKVGNQTINALDFSTSNSDWSPVTYAQLKSLLEGDNILMSYTDERFAAYGWKSIDAPHISEDADGTTRLYKDGADYYLCVRYYADTQIRIVGSDGTALEVAYSGGIPVGGKYTAGTVADGKYTPGVYSSGELTDPSKTYNVYYAMNAEGYYAETPSHKYYAYKEEPAVTVVVKEPVPFAVYSSSPEAYAELKNWGVASTDEPYDSLGLGNGRSPVDYDAGVSTTSNGSSVISEDYEVMAGVPATEKLYLAVGGSEFIIDIALQYVANETAVRSYSSVFKGVDCQFNWQGASGSGADIPEDAHWLPDNIPQVSGFNANVSGTPSHNGFTLTLTLSGEIKNDSSTRPTNTVEKSDSQTADTTASASASAEAVGKAPQTATAKADATANGVETLHDSSTSASASVSVSATAEADPNASDVANFNNAMTAAEKWSNDMVAWLNAVPTFVSGSDKVGRNINSSTITEAFIVNRLNLTTEQSATGEIKITTPINWFNVQNDGTEAAFKIADYSITMTATNPADVTVTDSNTDSDSQSDSQTCSYKEATGTPPSGGESCGNEMATAPTAKAQTEVSVTAVPSSATTWTATVEFTIRPHVLCGPCCNHVLPAINDTWQQTFNYDYVKIIGLSVLRLDQGSAADLSIDASGLKALIGTEKLGVSRITYFSSLSYNIAQANIFDYMGLQTDGTKDVNTATNEYFRSIAVGNGTYGSTKASEAGRVRYWITNSDESKVTAKGPTFDRLVYKGNTAGVEKFDNELKSVWQPDFGLFAANDYLQYDFGNRSNICDGTSRGYQHNINKSSWVEQFNGTWRGRAAYDVPWGKGFLYDGIGAGGRNCWWE